jgi:hypothetical protein
MASQSAANLATEATGTDVIPPERVSPAVQKKGANQQALMGMIPTDVTDLTGAGLAMAVAPALKRVGQAAEGATKVAKELDIPADDLVPAVKAAQKKLKAYHATRNDFEKFGPAPEYRGSTYLALTPEGARKGSTGGAQDYPDVGDRRPQRLLEVELPDEGIEGLHWTPKEREWFDSMPDRIEGDEALNAAFQGQPNNGNISWDDVYEPRQIGDRLYEYIKKPPKTYSLDDVVKTNRDIYGGQLPGYQDRDVEAAKRLRDAGMKGYLLNDEAGVSIAHIDPETLEIVPAVKAAQKKLTYKHPISGVKLTTPIEEMQVDTKPFGKMVEEKQLSPEWLLNKVVVPMRGDPAAAGISITGLGGRPFTKPVDMKGGPGYPQMEENVKAGRGWASKQAQASGQANRAVRLNKEYEGADIVGLYQKMGERSTAFNTFTPEILHQMFMLDRPKISNVDVAEFDRIMREVPLDVSKKTGKAGRPAYPDWPGLDNLTPEYLRKGAGPTGDGKVRNKMFDLMDSKIWQDKGFPNTGYANYAGTDRRLLNTPTNTSGASVVTYDPQGRTMKSDHPTYETGVAATYEGRLPDLPLDVLYEGYRETGGTGGGPIPNSQLVKFLDTKPPLVKVDEPTLERFMKYLRTQDGFKWGIGGAVAAGLLSQEQADEINQAGQT